MIDRILKAKHWQIFMLTFGIPLLGQMILIVKLISSSRAGTALDATIFATYLKIAPLLILLFMGLYYTWIWSVNIGLQRQVPPALKQETKWFKACYFLSFAYVLGILLFMSSAPLLWQPAASNQGLAIRLASIILPFHLLAMACHLYACYCTAKSLKIAELRERIGASACIGEFIMILFFPIGIWILQPRINAVIEQQAPQ